MKDYFKIVINANVLLSKSGALFKRISLFKGKRDRILNERAKRADFDMFVKMLEKVPDVEPMEFDRL